MSTPIGKPQEIQTKRTRNKGDLSEQVINVVGNKITWLREMRNWDASELAERVKVSRQTLSNYEKPDWECSVNMMKKIADACGIHPSYFFYDIFPDDYLSYAEDFRLIVLELGQIEESRRQILREAIISLISSFKLSELRDKAAGADNSKTPQVPFPDHYISQKKLYRIKELLKAEKFD